MMTPVTPVTIIGAGPFGLSVAAYFSAIGIEPRVIGIPMNSWRSNMPKGMLLKSAGFSSNLSSPDGSFSLAEFCRGQGIPYKDSDLPIGLETFSAYGMAFQKRFVPQLEEDKLIALNKCKEGFDL